MLIRETIPEDLDELEALFAKGRAFMQKNGNSVQWHHNYPPRAFLEADMAKHQSYVVEEDGRIIGSFVLQLGDDPTYAVIEGGSWKNDAPYGTMHRVVSDGTHHALFDEMVRWAFDRIPNLRGDTHALNQSMQRAFLRNGFEYCGIIYVADGTPRYAYQKTGA